MIALFTLEPYPTYVMEFPDGSSGVAIEPDFERADNKSLDASGGSVFRIMIGPAMLE